MVVKINDICKNVFSGGTPNRKRLEYYKGGNIPWLNTGEIKFNRIYKTEQHITEDGFNSSSAKNVPINSVIVAMYGATAARVAINKIKLTTNQACCNLVIDEKKADYRYVYYYLCYKYHHLASLANGGAQQNLNTQQIKHYSITIPNLEKQKKIADVLSDIDDKIEINNQINDNLFELLKIEFKTKFYNKNSDAKLLDYISNTIGGDWGKELPVDNYNTKVYCVRGADIPNMEYGNKGNAPTRYILEKNYNNKKLKPNNIIVEISGGSPTQSTGRTAYITENILNMYDAPLLCTNFCRAIETKKNIYAPFVYMYLTLMYEDDIFFNWENGTTGIKNLALNDLLLNIEITKPNEEELNRYYILFNSIMNKISNNSNENIKLEILRDTLLPKLMNGEIDLDKIEI
ncbi:MAG: restriction endonuclease subunit S [Clostridia bacterium]